VGRNNVGSVEGTTRSRERGESAPWFRTRFKCDLDAAVRLLNSNQRRRRGYGSARVREGTSSPLRSQGCGGGPCWTRTSDQGIMSRRKEENLHNRQYTKNNQTIGLLFWLVACFSRLCPAVSRQRPTESKSCALRPGLEPSGMTSTPASAKTPPKWPLKRMEEREESKRCAQFDEHYKSADADKIARSSFPRLASCANCITLAKRSKQC